MMSPKTKSHTLKRKISINVILCSIAIGFMLQMTGKHSVRAMSDFGSEFEKIWPRRGNIFYMNNFGRKLLQQCTEVKQPLSNAEDVNIKNFMKLAAKFPLKFGTDTCRVMSQPAQRHQQIRHQIASTYPVLHERALALYLEFLEHKLKYGNQLELALYANLSLTDFVQRLLEKRCVAFVGSDDSYLLINGANGYGRYESVGTLSEQHPLLLKNVLSYDEVKLSALLSVSSHSEFLNSGSRDNLGRLETDKSKIEPEGVIIGLIGGRFEREGVMESQDIIISQDQNNVDNGYGYNDTNVYTRSQDYRRIWKHFYEEQDFLYTQVHIDGERFGAAYGSLVFDNLVMKKRYTISIDTLLLESEARAVAADKQAYVHVVGIGLGVWKIASQQSDIFLKTFEQRLRLMIDKLPHVSYVHFSYFRLKTDWTGLQDKTIIESPAHPQKGIQVFISNRNPADKLQQPNLLPIVSYAWDGNALPGNEFWQGSLNGSGDPAAACSTLITELHNPHINKVYANGTNLHIASEQHGILHISEYAKRILEQTDN